MGNTGGDKAQDLVRTEFGLSGATVSASGNNNTVTVTANAGGSSTGSATLKVNITGGFDQFNKLVDELKSVTVTKITKGEGASDIVRKLVGTDLLAKQEVKTAIQELIKEDFKVSGATDVNVSQGSDGNNVTVTINGQKGSETPTGTSNVSVNTGSAQTVPIQVKGTGVTGLDTEKAKAIAIAIVLALVNDDVKEKISDGVTFKLENDKQPEITIQVNQAKSETQANRVAWKLGKALEKVNEINVVSSTGPKLKLSLSLDPWFKPGNV